MHQLLQHGRVCRLIKVLSLPCFSRINTMVTQNTNPITYRDTNDVACVSREDMITFYSCWVLLFYYFIFTPLYLIFRVDKFTGLGHVISQFGGRAKRYREYFLGYLLLTVSHHSCLVLVYSVCSPIHFSLSRSLHSYRNEMEFYSVSMKYCFTLAGV